MRGVAKLDSTIIAQKDTVIALEREKEDIYKDKIQQLEIEVWIYRVGAVALIIFLL